MTIRIVRLLALILLACSLTVDLFGQNSTIIGVLEDVPGEYADAPHWFGVRVVFEKQSTRWRAFPTTAPEGSFLRTLASKYPKKVSWTITFDGRRLGQVTSQNPDGFDSYSRIGLQKVAEDNGIPSVGKRSAEYGGFTDAVIFRPLVANSMPYIKDPEHWKPTQATPAQISELRRAFRNKSQSSASLMRRTKAS